MSKHPIVHVEISARDLEAAGKFYADVFDWKVKYIRDELCHLRNR
jgi:predicted enzyme related to lactoylglutathione lyase